MEHYIYEGPVMLFDKCIKLQWKGETHAKSANKALSNLAYQFKRSNNMGSTSKITLPGELLIKEKEKYYGWNKR